MALIAGIVAVVTLYLLLQMFRSANPAMMARGLKIGGGIVSLAAAAFIGVRGELAVAIPLGIFGAGLLGWSPLGLNIHPTYGLWHAYRAALLFPVAFDLPVPRSGAHPCDSCLAKPCLSACPVHAFSPAGYDVPACAGHLKTSRGEACMSRGCLARHACPVGQGLGYAPAQAEFHMRAFLVARQ